jgi:bacteriorhodopsin
VLYFMIGWREYFSKIMRIFVRKIIKPFYFIIYFTLYFMNLKLRKVRAERKHVLKSRIYNVRFLFREKYRWYHVGLESFL